MATRAAGPAPGDRLPDGRSPDGRYTRVAVALHWLVAVLVIANLLIGLLHDSLLRGTMPLHKSIGLTVLALAVVRLAWRLLHPAPPLPPHTPRWERWLARGTQAAFYLLIILLPLSGWVFTSAGSRKYPTDVFGLFTVPPIVRQDPAVADTVATRHTQLAYLMIALVVLHVAGALKHRFIDRDRVLERMLPGAGPTA